MKKISKITMYKDQIGKLHKDENLAQRANHELDLKIRKEIENCIVTFSDGKIDKLATSLRIIETIGISKKYKRKINVR